MVIIVIIYYRFFCMHLRMMVMQMNSVVVFMSLDLLTCNRM